MKTKTLIAAIFFSGLIYAQEKPKTDSAATKNIEAVTLTKQVFKKESDRFVYDVAASPVAKGNTAFNILKQTPLVSSTDDKTLKIIGKNNAVIFINGRKTNMDAESLTQFLKNTPAENIQKIEVITLPGSEYQVESSDGIINIVLKKKMTDGLNGNMRMGNSQSYYNSSYASLSLNYRKDKLGISSNINTSQNIQEQYYILKNGTATASNQSEGRVSDPNKNLGGYLNLDYQLNDNSNLALTWNSWANRSYGSTSNLFNTITGPNAKGEQETKYNYTKNLENSRSYNNSLNLNYEWKTDTLGSKVNLNAAYLNYKRFQNADNRTYGFDSFPVMNTDASTQIIQSTPQVINNFSFLGDYIKKLKNDFTVSVGGNYNKTKTDNDTKSDTFNSGSLTDSNPNHYIYDENIYGAYLTLEKKFSDKFSGKIGSRYEMTNSIGKSDNNKNPELNRIERDYNNFLPYISVNYAINDKNNISYAFSSRMRRPSFWELNPVKNYLTDVNYTQNNPFVKAASVYTNELTYMFKNSYFLILNHSYSKNVITQVPLQGIVEHPDGTRGTGNELRYIRTNFGDKQEMSAMLGMQKSFFKQYLTTNFNVGLQFNRNNGNLSVDPTTGDRFGKYDGAGNWSYITYSNKVNSTSALIQTNNTLRLDKKKTWFLGVNYWYVDNQQIEIGRLKSLMSLDANIKKVWNDWTFALEIYDLLKTNKVVISDYQTNGNFNYINQNQYNQSVNFSITYNFGNKKVQKIRDIDSADKDIKNRTR
jgi:iron complex outermembrane receptor protein